MGFCSNCGSEIKEGTVFCSNCGAKTADAGQQQAGNTQGMQNNNTYGNFTPQSNKPNNNKIIGMAVVGVAALVGLFILVKLFGVFTTPGYEKPLQYVCDGLEKGNLKTMMKAFPSYITEEMEDYYDDYADVFADNMKEQLEEEFGKNVKVSYKVTDKDKLDKDDIEELVEDIEYFYDEKVKIKDAYELEVEMKVKGKDGSDESEDSITVIKIGSKWYMYDDSFLGF